MKYLGDIAEDATIDFKFTTHDSTGAPATLSGTPVISVYKANGTTESTAGVTLTAGFDSRTGLNHVRIDTSADAFYAAAADYQVVITTGTVDGVSVVGYVVAEFSIENRYQRISSARAGYLDKLNVSGTLAHSDAASTYKADVSGLSTLDASGVRSAVGLATANLDTQFSGIAAAVWAAGTRTLTAISDSTGITTLLDRLSSARAGYLDKLNVSGTLAHSDAANTYKADVSGLSTLDAAGVRTAVGLASANLDTQLGDLPTVSEFNARTIVAADYATAAALTTVDTVVDAIKVTTDKIDDTLELDSTVYRFTTNALEQAPTGGSAPTAGEIADAVWDETLSGHLGSGSTGEALNAAGAAGDPWTTTIPGAYGAGSAGYILGTNVDATISSRTSGSIPSASDNATAVWAAGTRTLTSFGSLVSDVATAVWGAGARTLTAIADSSGITTLLSRVTETRMAKLDVSGTLAHSDAANTYKADVSALASQASVDAVGAVTAKLDDTLEDNAGTYRLTAAALVNAPSGGGGGGDATAANQATIIGHLEDIKGATFAESTDALDAVRGAIDALALGPGTAPDPWRYRVAGPGDAPIPGAVVTLYDPISNNPVAAARTDSLGVATLYPDPGEYVVGTARAGFTFDNETVTVPEP